MVATPDFGGGEQPRIYSRNIPRARKMGMSYNKLKQAMYKFTGAPKADATFDPFTNTGDEIRELWKKEMEKYDQFNYSKMPYMPPSYMPFPDYGISHDSNKPEGAKDLRLVIFYGFNGMLAQKFSWAEGMSIEEAQARMAIAGDKVPYKVMYAQEFIPIQKQFVGTPNELIEIPLDDAMNIIRAGVDPNREYEEFDDAEVDEFDDNCLESCRPGEHFCGK